MEAEIARARAAMYEPIAAITKYISAINIALRAKLSPDAAIQSRTRLTGLNTPNCTSPVISDKNHDLLKLPRALIP